jgi:hypothetical protein
MKMFKEEEDFSYDHQALRQSNLKEQMMQELYEVSLVEEAEIDPNVNLKIESSTNETSMKSPQISDHDD